MMSLLYLLLIPLIIIQYHAPDSLVINFFFTSVTFSASVVSLFLCDSAFTQGDLWVLSQIVFLLKRNPLNMQIQELCTYFLCIFFVFASIYFYLLYLIKKVAQLYANKKLAHISIIGVYWI